MRVFAVLSWIWFLAAAAYGTWEYVGFSGLYRWLAELQLGMFGRYYGSWTLIVSIFLLGLPGLATLSALEREKRRRQAFEEAHGVPQPTLEELQAEASARARRHNRVMLWIAPVCFLVAGIAYWLGQQQALPAGAPVVQVDLAALGTSEPPSGRVMLIGQVLAAPGVTTSSEMLRRIEENYYAPIVARDDTGRREDFRFYVRRSVVRSAGDPRLAQVFYGNPTGILIRNGLPGDARALFERKQIEVTEPHWVLSSPTVRTDTYYVVAMVSGLVGTVLILAAFAAWGGQRIRERRNLGGSRSDGR